MLIIGLCGGSGSGKSAVAGILRNSGLPVFDSDEAYRRMTYEKSACTIELGVAFGNKILNEDGSLNRQLLSEIVFAPTEEGTKNRTLLNTISHRHVTEAFESWCHTQDEKGYRTVVIDAPLLFESKLNQCCAAIIGVTAPREMRVTRIIKRDGISRDAALRRIDSQLPDQELKEKCDYLIENVGTIEEMQIKVNEVLSKIRERGLLS